MISITITTSKSITITITISGWSANDRGGGGSWLTDHSSWMSRGQDKDQEDNVIVMMTMIMMIMIMITLITPAGRLTGKTKTNKIL